MQGKKTSWEKEKNENSDISWYFRKFYPIRVPIGKSFVGFLTEQGGKNYNTIFQLDLYCQLLKNWMRSPMSNFSWCFAKTKPFIKKYETSSNLALPLLTSQPEDPLEFLCQE